MVLCVCVCVCAFISVYLIIWSNNGFVCVCVCFYIRVFNYLDQ